MNDRCARFVDSAMRLVALLLVLGLGASRAHAADGDQIVLDRDSLRHQLESLKKQVEAAEKALAGEQADAKKIGLELAGIREEFTDLLRKVNAARSIDSVGQMGAKAGNATIVTSAVYVSPIGDASLRIVMERIKHETGHDGKMRVLKDATANAFFVADQCIKVLGTFSIVEDRLKALELMLPRLLDRQHAQKILVVFPFAGERERARSAMAKVFAQAPAPVPTSTP